MQLIEFDACLDAIFQEGCFLHQKSIEMYGALKTKASRIESHETNFKAVIAVLKCTLFKG